MAVNESAAEQVRSPMLLVRNFRGRRHEHGITGAYEAKPLADAGATLGRRSPPAAALPWWSVSGAEVGGGDGDVPVPEHRESGRLLLLDIDPAVAHQAHVQGPQLPWRPGQRLGQSALLARGPIGQDRDVAVDQVIDFGVPDCAP